MSSLFGPPPPPPSRIFEPQAYEDEEYYFVAEEPHRGRRRLALLMAFLAGGLLVFANLATWLHTNGVQQKQADRVAAATYDSATQPLVAPIAQSLARVAGTPGGTSPSEVASPVDTPSTADDLDTAVRAAIADPSARQVWRNAVADTLAQQQALLDGAQPQNDAVTVRFTTERVTATAVASLKKVGYTFPSAGVPADDYVVTIKAASGSTVTLLGTAQNLWLLLWALVLGFGAAAIALASRRLRMACILGIDAVVMLAGVLVLVELARSAAGDQAVQTNQVAIVTNAFDALTRSLVSQTLALMVFAGVAAAVCGVLARGRGRSEVADRPA